MKAHWHGLWGTGAGLSEICPTESFPSFAGALNHEGSNIMKALLTRVFLLATLAGSMAAIGSAAPLEDEKMNTTCTPAAASASQSGETKSQPEKKMKNEKQKMKKEKGQKKMEDDNYPGFGIFG
jgi:hypothetical protein